MRAHLTQTVAESEDNRDLINLFLKGLAQESTKMQTWAFLLGHSPLWPKEPKT